MNSILKTIAERKSVREFSPERISKTNLQNILEAVRRAPSGKNTQPWKLFLLSEEPLEALRKDYCNAFDSEKPAAAEINTSLLLPYKNRAMELGRQIFAHKGILREDKIKRKAHDRANFEFFNAPQIFVLAVDKNAYHEGTLMDCGIFAGYLMLAIDGAGYGCCPQTSTIIYPDILRNHIPHSENFLFLMIFPFGKALPESKLNLFRSDREPVSSWFSEIHGG